MRRAIRALCAVGMVMLPAFAAMAQKPDLVTYISPSNGAEDISLTPQFKWTQDDLADEYRIRISTDEDQANLVLSTDVVDTMFTLPDALDNGRIYYWTVRTRNAEGFGPRPDPWSFSTVTGGPTQVSLVSPNDGAADADVNPILTWSSVSGAANYRLQVSTAPNFSTTVIDNSSINGTQFQASLNPEETYHWRVKASNAGQLNWSEAWSFTTGSGDPEKIVLSSPSDGATNVSATPQLSWQADPAANEYRVQVASDENFNDIIHQVNVATTDWTTPELDYATEHFWRVRGIGPGGNGPYSDKWSFTTEAGGPTQVTLSSPSNGATDVELDPVLSWNTVSGGMPYRIQLSTSANFNTTVVDDTNVNATQYEAGNLDGSTTYYWRVLANSAPPSNWSATWSFTTGEGSPGQIVLQSPSNGASDVPISTSFSWETDPVATTYRFQLSKQADFSEYVLNDQNVTSSPFTPEDVLDPGTQYYWRVRGISTVGAGPFSEEWTFTTAASAPGKVTLTSPANNATNVSSEPSFSWAPEDNSDTYDIQISTTADFAVPVVSAAGLTDTQYDSSPLSSGTPYFWRVRGGNVAGKGPWSDIFSFTTLPGGSQQVVLTSPANNSTDVGLAPLLRWGAVTNAASYALQVSTQSNFGSTVINRDAVTATQFQTSELSGDTRYFWRVRASNAGPANWSDTWSFTTSSGTPSQVTLFSPPDHTQTIPVTTPLRWNQAQGADSYDVQVTTVEDDFSELFYEASGITGTEHTVPTLRFGDVYWWRVRAVNESGAGEWSDSWGFLTERGGPHQPLILSPEPGATGVSLEPLLVWSSVPEELSKGQAVTYHVQVATSFSFTAGSIVQEESMNPDTTFQLSDLLPDTTYAWRVKASVAEQNNWTITSSFVTGTGAPGQVVLAAPLNGATEIPLETQLTWNVPVRATSFNLQVSLDPSFTSVIVSETGLDDITYNLVGLNPTTDYWWRVQAINQDGLGEWSEPWIFSTVGFTAPQAPVLVSPLNGAEEVSFMPLFTWNASDGATSYKLEISTNPTFSTVAIAVVVTQPFYQADGLLLGQGYFWRVEARNAGGSAVSDIWGFTTVQSTDVDSDEIPAEFAVGQNYPNPFNPSTNIEVNMPRAANARLVIYNVRGEEVARLVDGYLPAGTHRVTWNAADLPSGVYIYRFQADEFVETRKLTLAK